MASDRLGASSTHTSTHTNATDFSTGIPQATASGGTSSLSSPGAISGIVIGALVLLGILGGITRRLQRRNADPVIMHVEPPPQPPPMVQNMSTGSASNTINFYGLHAAPVHSNSNSTAYNFSSAPPAPYPPVTFAPPAPNLHQNSSYHPPASWAGPLQPAPFNQNVNPPTSYTPAASQPQPPSPAARPEPKYYGGGDYVLSWDTPAPDSGSSRPPPTSNSQPPSREVDAGPFPPSYTDQWK
ncbi:hypothetical protein FB451DRAFT_727266 [Mycena latifolia]|nr:hypothetical protein FB451DRAFT_727266 [Mycena latifolia]